MYGPLQATTKILAIYVWQLFSTTLFLIYWPLVFQFPCSLWTRSPWSTKLIWVDSEHSLLKQLLSISKRYWTYLHSPGTEQPPCNRLQPCLQIAEKEKENKERGREKEGWEERLVWRDVRIHCARVTQQRTLQPRIHTCKTQPPTHTP